MKKHAEKLDLPAVPSFELPKPYPDGSHSVKEMRVRGKKYLNTDVAVKGYVTWAYDCVTAVRKENMSDAEVMKLIEEDITICQRPNLYIGDEPSTPIEKSLWVVGVPRAPTKIEVKNLPREEIAAWPAVPPYKVGDEVVVTGQFTQSSPNGERSSGGLLVYGQFKNTTQNWESPPPAPTPGGAPTGAPPPPGTR